MQVCNGGEAEGAGHDMQACNGGEAEGAGHDTTS